MALQGNKQENTKFWKILEEGKLRQLLWIVCVAGCFLRTKVNISFAIKPCPSSFGTFHGFIHNSLLERDLAYLLVNSIVV